MTNEDEIEREATEWFLRLLEPSASRVSSTQFAKWLLQSPRHVQAYLSVARTWASIGQLDAIPSPDELIRAARHDTALPGRRWKASPYQAHLDLWTKVTAATVVLIALVGVGRLLLDRWDSSSRFATEIGQQRTISLKDGSTVQLNTSTELAVRFAENQRWVQLDRGEARFAVVPDSQRPFIVSTPEATVRAVGTVFNVQTVAGRTAVTVIEGRVDVSETLDRLTAPRSSLNAGEGITLSDTGELTPNTDSMLERVQAWPKQLIVFHDEPLADVVAEFNRYNKSQIRIADPDLAGLEISGTFAADDPASLLDFLRRYHGTEVVVAADGSQVLRWHTSAEIENKL